MLSVERHPVGRDRGRWLALLLGSGAVLAACSSEPAPPARQEPRAATTAAVQSSGVEGQAPVGAVITLEPTSAPAALPPGPAVLDQFSKAFVPEVLIVRVGQVVEFRNSEDVDHNVAVIRAPTGTQIFDTSTAPFQKYEHTFDRAGRYEVTCDVHPGMRATIFATSAPYSTIVDNSRRFRFADLKPGPYRLMLVNGPAPVERLIEVGSTTVDVGTFVQ
jgi:plastocyanin